MFPVHSFVEFVVGVSYGLFAIGFVALLVGAYLGAAIISLFAQIYLQRLFEASVKFSELCPCIFGGILCSGLIGFLAVLSGVIAVDAQGQLKSQSDAVIFYVISFFVTPAFASLLLKTMDGKSMFWKASCAIALSQVTVPLLCIAIVYAVFGIMLAFGQ